MVCHVRRRPAFGGSRSPSNEKGFRLVHQIQTLAFLRKRKLLGFYIVSLGDDTPETVQDCFGMRTIHILILSLLAAAANAAVVYDCYTPVPGGWEIHLTGNKNARFSPQGLLTLDVPDLPPFQLFESIGRILDAIRV